MPIDSCTIIRAIRAIRVQGKYSICVSGRAEHDGFMMGEVEHE